MGTEALISRLQQKLREFGPARRGNVAVTFALGVIPILGCIGAAVDYSHANDIKVKLQAAVDSTALMLSKEASRKMTLECLLRNSMALGK